MPRNVYAITLPNGKIRWTYNRPQAKDVAWKIVGQVDGTSYIEFPGYQVSDHPHGKPGTYQTWLSVIR